MNERKREGSHPSLSEIGNQFGYNKSTIYRYLMEMKEDGMTEAVEVGPGKVLQGLIGRTYRDVTVSGRQ